MSKFNDFAASVTVGHLYRVECIGPDGELKWVDGFENLVVTAGLNKYLDATLKTGLASPAWYVGLKASGAPVAGDTMGSHASWAESTIYSQANRPQWTAGTISGGSVDNSGTVAAFTINAAGTVWGAFLADNNTKGGTTGTLLGAGDFASSKVVGSGDTLNVTVTCSMTST